MSNCAKVSTSVLEEVTFATTSELLIATAALPSILYVYTQSCRLQPNNSCGEVSDDSDKSADELESKNGTIAVGQTVSGINELTIHVNEEDGPTFPAASTAHTVTTGASPS